LLIEQKIISGKNPAHSEWVLNEWAKTPTHVLQGITSTLDNTDTAPLLPRITVPTLILAPAHSPITPLTDQISMRTSIPNARIAVIEGPGHETYVDETRRMYQRSVEISSLVELTTQQLTFRCRFFRAALGNGPNEVLRATFPSEL
jgi:hypothetical protein